MKTQKFKYILFYFSAILINPMSISYSHAQQNCGSAFAGQSKASSAPLSPSVKKMMDHLDGSVETLYQTSGFKNESEIIGAAEMTPGKAGRMYRSAWFLLREENLMVGTRLPQKIRMDIVKKGFLNLHQSKNSQGAAGDRNHVESSYANMSDADWKKISDEDKPKYAALYPHQDSNLFPPQTLDTYAGSDVYYYNTDRIRERMTITAGDSLNRFVNYNGYWSPESHKAESWDQLFVPWMDRALFIPVLAEGLNEGRMGLPEIEGLEFQKPLDYGMQGEVLGQGPMSPFKMKWVPNMDYLEIQIWGKLTLDDVAIFEYKNDPPTGAFLAELNKRGIVIRLQDEK